MRSNSNFSGGKRDSVSTNYVSPEVTKHDNEEVIQSAKQKSWLTTDDQVRVAGRNNHDSPGSPGSLPANTNLVDGKDGGRRLGVVKRAKAFFGQSRTNVNVTSGRSRDQQPTTSKKSSSDSLSLSRVASNGSTVQRERKTEGRGSVSHSPLTGTASNSEDLGVGGSTIKAVDGGVPVTLCIHFTLMKGKEAKPKTLSRVTNVINHTTGSQDSGRGESIAKVDGAVLVIPVTNMLGNTSGDQHPGSGEAAVKGVESSLVNISAPIWPNFAPGDQGSVRDPGNHITGSPIPSLPCVPPIIVKRNNDGALLSAAPPVVCVEHLEDDAISPAVADEYTETGVVLYDGRNGQDPGVSGSRAKAVDEAKPKISGVTDVNTIGAQDPGRESMIKVDGAVSVTPATHTLDDASGDQHPGRGEAAAKYVHLSSNNMSAPISPNFAPGGQGSFQVSGTNLDITGSPIPSLPVATPVTRVEHLGGDAISPAVADEHTETDVVLVAASGSRLPFGGFKFNRLWRRNAGEQRSNKLGEGLGENDVVIAVTGEEGKDSFVDTVRGDDPSSCHNAHHGKIQYTIIRYPPNANRSIVLVYVSSSDAKISDTLESVSTWLAESFGDEKKLAGIIHLHNITSPPLSESSQKDYKAFEKYIGESAITNLTFATTGWKEFRLETGERREMVLKEHWKPFIRRGATVLRFSATHESARAIVDPIVSTADYKPAAQSRKVYKEKESKANDQFMDDPRSTDIVIPVMGPTGVGKSTFINTVAGKEVTTVGHNLKSQTAQLQHIVLRYPKDPNRRIILVDTPGFDDTYVPDSEILRRIGVWLARSYTANMRLSGVIYLHEISQTRMLGTALKNLDMLNKLCGEEGTKNVILATTKWNEVQPETGVRREQQLKERHWQPMLELGSQLGRFSDSQQSGWEIIERILDNPNRDTTDAVAIQQELVEINKILPETDAGRTLRYTLEELMETQRQTAKQLRVDQGNPEMKDALAENERKIRATADQLTALNIPISRRLKNFLSPGKAK